MSMRVLLRTLSQFAITLRVSWTHAPCLSKLDVLGAFLLGAGLKSWGDRCGVQTLLRGSFECEFLLDCGSLWGSWHDCISAFSTHFSVGLL